REVAVMLKLTEGSARALLHRARTSLQAARQRTSDRTEAVDAPGPASDIGDILTRSARPPRNLSLPLRVKEAMSFRRVRVLPLLAALITVSCNRSQSAGPPGGGGLPPTTVALSAARVVPIDETNEY